ncbi:MAG: glycosyl transferase [Firmicutes bacterium HGW-Firmicutes-1]|jgi:glycosyltransferase involved in cell wall biosynthesis|nr:MAG: glycosyl transferase [Firmicutes bacterium HGW-Firmicutes-1]
MKQLKITVITVCLNSEKTIERTIESVLRQTYDNYEYIIVDGGSKDRTLSIIEQYRDKFGNKMILISEPDKGLYDAMNKGIKIASGDAIAIINSDDYLEHDALENINKGFVISYADVVCGNIAFVKKDKYNKEYKTIDSTLDFTKANKSIYKRIRHYSHPSTIIKKCVYDQCGLYDDQYHISADYDFMIRMILNKVKMHYINNTICYFTMNGVSQSQRARGIKENKDINKKYFGDYYSLFFFGKESILITLKRLVRFKVKWVKRDA